MNLRIIKLAFVLAVATIGNVALAGGDVTLRVNADAPHQVMEGFGATTISLVYDSPLGDTLGPELRKATIEAAYGQVMLNTGNLEFDYNCTVPTTQNSGDKHADRTFGARAMKTKLIDPAAPMGFTDYFLCPNIRMDHGHNPQLVELRKADYGKFVEAGADQLASAAKLWRDQFQIVPRFIMPFNEPTSGNHELAGGDSKQVVELIRAIGKRLRAEGFNDIKLVVPCEETVAKSLATAEAILADDEARPFVGAIGYHCYPYGSPYASVPNILKESGAGKPDEKEIEIRGKLRDLGHKYGVPLWMTEVSHSEVPAFSFDALRGRAIHIHDELLYADASAFYGMFNVWDLTSYREHFKGRGGDVPGALYNEGDTIVLIDNEKRKVDITGIGYAIGHYARWIHRGAVRLEVESSDPLLQATAFRDDVSKRFVIVAINNATESRNLNIQIKGLTISGSASGEQSMEKSYWQPIAPLTITRQDGFTATLPPLSVTTIATPMGDAH